MLTNFETPAALFGAIFATLACILLLGIRRKIGRRSGISYEKITSFFESMRDEFARNRKETGEQGQAQREEQRRLQEAFEKKIEANFQGQNEVLRQKFEDLVKQLETQNKQSLEALKDVRGAVEKQLKDIREDNGKRLEEMRKTVNRNQLNLYSFYFSDIL